MASPLEGEEGKADALAVTRSTPEPGNRFRARPCYARAATRRARPRRAGGPEPMEVKLGVTNNPKELEIDIDQSADEVAKTVEDAISLGARMLWLVDSNGRRVGIPIERLAYIEFGEENRDKRVGFGSR
jgi:hypothetical protein